MHQNSNDGTKRSTRQTACACNVTHSHRCMNQHDVSNKKTGTGNSVRSNDVRALGLPEMRARVYMHWFALRRMDKATDTYRPRLIVAGKASNASAIGGGGGGNGKAASTDTKQAAAAIAATGKREDGRVAAQLQPLCMYHALTDQSLPLLLTALTALTALHSCPLILGCCARLNRPQNWCDQSGAGFVVCRSGKYKSDLRCLRSTTE